MTTKRHSSGLARAALGSACALGVLITAGAGAATAQAADAQAPWQAWTGCWEPVTAEGAPTSDSGPPVVCFVPQTPASVDVITLVDGTATERERITLGVPRASGGEGCTGTETIAASPDARRLYRTGEHSCQGSLARRSSGMMTMLPTGEWLDVESVTVVDFTDVVAVRYRPVAAPAAVEAEVAAAREGRAMAIDAARSAAAAPIEIAHVVEATRALAPEVVEAWLVEREQGFDLDARRLLELADAGVPGRVTDLMVALSHPRRFTVNRNLRTPSERPTERVAATAPPRVVRPGFGFGPSWYPAFGYGWSARYGYGSAFFPYGVGFAGQPAVIIVRGSEDGAEAAPRGRAVPGRGYTRTPRSGRGTSTGSDSAMSPSRGGSSGSSGTSASPARGSGGGDSGSGRTARPRPQSD